MHCSKLHSSLAIYLFPQILGVEEGDALDLKITINLRKGDASAGSLQVAVGSLQLLLLHRVLRLVQLYLCPLDLEKVCSRLLPAALWLLGPSIRILQSRDRHIGIKVKVDGATLLLPEMKENQHLFCINLGKVSMENMMTHSDAVENLLVEVTGGQVTRAVMNPNQCIEERDIILEEFGCKVDIKRNRGKKTKEAVLSMDNITVVLAPKDIQLALHVLQNNLVRTAEELKELVPTLPFTMPEEHEPLLLEDSKWCAHVMVDQVGT